jgi:hypothetical protein
MPTEHPRQQLALALHQIIDHTRKATQGHPDVVKFGNGINLHLKYISNMGEADAMELLGKVRDIVRPPQG